MFQIVVDSCDPFLKLYVCLHISEWKWKSSHFVQWCVHVCSCLLSIHLFWECCWECVGWNLAPSSLRRCQARHYTSQSFTITELTYSSLREKIIKNKIKTNKWKALFTNSISLCVSIFIICTNSIHWHFSIFLVLLCIVYKHDCCEWCNMQLSPIGTILNGQ